MSDTTDLRGITHRRALAIALPILFANVTVPLLALAGTAVVGQLGRADAIGAVAIGGVILGSSYWVFGFLRMGTSGLVAQARGAGDPAEASAILMRGLLIAAVVGLAFVALQLPFFRGAFALSPATPEVEALARTYMMIRIWGAPAAIAGFAITGWLIAVERTRAVLVLQLFINLLNLVLSLAFVLSFGWGVPGVGLAALIAEWAGLGLGLWLCRAALTGGRWRDRRHIFDAVRLRQMLRVNTDIMIRTALLTFSFTAITFFGAGFGDVTLAANQILLEFLAVSAFALDGFAFAAESLVGQATGARKPASLRRAAVLTSLWGSGFVLLTAAVFAGLGPWIINFITPSENIRAATMNFLPWVVAAPLVGLACWMLDGIFIGAPRTRDMRNAAILSTAIFGIALWGLSAHWGNHGIWAALMVSYVARALTLGVHYPSLERAAA
jgi:multidrug resistance protein, MATE family